MSVSANYPAFKLMLIRCIKREVAECRRRTIIKLLMQFTLGGGNPQFYDVVVINVSSGVSGFMQQNCTQIALLGDHVHKWPVSSSQSFATISLQLLGRTAASRPLTWVAEHQLCSVTWRDESQISERCTCRRPYTYLASPKLSWI